MSDAEDGVEYEVQRFRGSFGLQTPFTGVGPEVDAAWDNITDGKYTDQAVVELRVSNIGPIGGAIGITEDEWKVANPNHEYPVMLKEDHSTGRYLASLDVFHQLHCVVSLRCFIKVQTETDSVLSRISYARACIETIMTSTKAALLGHLKGWFKDI